MSSSEKMDLERDFAAGVYLPEAQNPVTPSPLTHCRYLFTQGQTEMSDDGIQMPAASPLMTMSTYNEYAMHACNHHSIFSECSAKHVSQQVKKILFFLTLIRSLAMVTYCNL
jgi:hypothetical protein